MVDVSLREATQVGVDATEGLLAAKDALVNCAAAVNEAESDLNHANWQVETAVAPVLATEAERALAAVERIKGELDGAHAVLSFLQHAVEPGPLRHKIMFALPSTPPGVRAPDLQNHPSLAPWREAKAALMRDAAAPLPIWRE